MDSSAATAVIFIAAFALVLGIIIVVNFANYQSRKLKSEERLTAIAKGVPLPAEPEVGLAELMERAARSSAARARGIRTGGVVLVSIGVGLGLFSLCLAWIIQEQRALVVGAAGLIPLAIGIGLLFDYALRTRGARAEADQSSSVRV